MKVKASHGLIGAFAFAPLLALPAAAQPNIVASPLCPDNTAGRLLSSFPSSVPPRTQPFGLPHLTSEERAVVVGASCCSFDFLPVETAAHRETVKIVERIGAKLAYLGVCRPMPPLTQISHTGRCIGVMNLRKPGLIKRFVSASGGSLDGDSALSPSPRWRGEGQASRFSIEAGLPLARDLSPP